jgi:hypothetical protein
MQLVGPYNTPRRIRLDLYTPAEVAIRAAVIAVEEAGAHPLLTDAVVLLQQAKEKVADFVELGTAGGTETCADKPHKGSSAVDQEWRKSLCVGWRKYENGVKSECWLRWTSPKGLYYWLHPVEGRWVGEPEQIKMPTFSTYQKAWEASQYCEKPVVDEQV